MPKLPRVSSAETIRALEGLGFIKVRQRGSHAILKKRLPKLEDVKAAIAYAAALTREEELLPIR